MFKVIDNDACQLYLDFVNDKATIFGTVGTFNKSSYKDSVDKWIALLEGLREEGYLELFSQIKKTQENILQFEQRLGFKVIDSTETDLLLMKEL